MRRIDNENWDRADLVEKYSTYVFPYINLGVDLDVTGLHHFTKENDLSFYCAMMHTAIKAALTIENFRYRLVDMEPYLCDRLDPSFVHLAKGQDRFLIVHGEYCDDILDFCRINMQKMREAERGTQTRGKISSESSKEILYITCIPWVKYTHFVRTIEDARTDNIPRLSWGKYEEDEHGRLIMPFSVQVHHALMDGYHAGIYMQRVQKLLDEFK